MATQLCFPHLSMLAVTKLSSLEGFNVTSRDSDCPALKGKTQNVFTAHVHGVTIDTIVTQWTLEVQSQRDARSRPSKPN